MSVDIDPGQLKRDLIAHAAQLLHETDATVALSDPAISDEGLDKTICTLKIARRELKLAKKLGKQFPTTILVFDIAEATKEPIASVVGIPEADNENYGNTPKRSIQEEFIVTLLGRADREEDQSLRGVAMEFYESRNHDGQKNPGKAIGGTIGGLFKTRNAIIEKLSQPDSDSVYIRRILDTVHAIPGHEEMAPQELLELLIENRDAERPAPEAIAHASAALITVSPEVLIPSAAELVPVLVFAETAGDQETASEATTTEKEKKEIAVKGNRMKAVALAVLEPNECANNFQNIRWSDIARSAYQDLLTKDPKRLHSLTGGAMTTRNDFVEQLQKYASGDTSLSALRANSLLDEIIEFYPIYQGKSVEVMIDILLKKVPFPTPPEVKRVKPGSLEDFEEKFGNRRREVILILLKINHDGTDFLYSKIEGVVSSVYGDKVLKGASEAAKKRQRELREATHLSREDIIARIAKHEKDPTQKDEELEALLAEIDAIPEYRGISRGRLLRVLRRHIPFSKLHSRRTDTLDRIIVEHDTVVTKERQLPDCGEGDRTLKGLNDTRDNHLPLAGSNYQRPLESALETILDKTLPLPSLPKLPESERFPIPRAKRIPYFLMMINDSRTDYLCTDVDTAIEAVCQEISVRMRSEGRRERLNRFRTTARQHYQDFVENLYEYDASKQDEGTTRDVHDFLFWAEHQPAYEGYTTKDIIHVLKREFKVSQIAQFYAEFVELSSKRVLRREQASSKRAARLPQNITSAVA